MSKSHRRFEALEPRYLLSGTRLFAAEFTAAEAVETEPAVEQQQLSEAETNGRADGFASLSRVESEVAQVQKVEELETVTPSDNSLDNESSESSAAVEPADVTSSNETTKTLTADRVSAAEPLKKIAIKSSKIVAVSNSNIAAELSDSNRSLENNQKQSITQPKETEQLTDNNESKTSDKERTDTAKSEEPDRNATNKPRKAETVAESDGEETGGEKTDSHKAWIAAMQETDDAEKTDDAKTSDNDLAVQLQKHTAVEAGRADASLEQSSVAENSPPVLRQTANQTEQTNPFAMAADRVFSAAQSESGSQSAASRMLPPAEGALLLVALGKPLTRLAAGDGGINAACVDGISPGLRGPSNRTRQKHRRKQESQDQCRRHGDVRNLTWLPPEKLSTDIAVAPVDYDPQETDANRTPKESSRSCTTNEAIFSDLDFAEPKDCRRASESWLPSFPSRDVWDGYGPAAGAVAAALSGTISALAVDRYRRAKKQPCIKLPMPAYTGRTLARI